MTEKINDFFGEVKNRWRSPLFSSFIISWCLVNWKVPIGMIFYDSKSLHALGYWTYVDLIKANRQLGLPVCMAIGYTLSAPVLRSAISLLEEKIKKITDKRRFKINEETTVAFKDYYGLSRSYKEKEVYLRDLISDQDTERANSARLASELHESKEAERRANDLFKLWTRGSEVFNNLWKINGSQWFDPNVVYEIRDGKITSLLDDGRDHKGKITTISIKGNDGTCIMRITLENKDDRYQDLKDFVFYELSPTNNTGQVWNGVESGTAGKVRFKVISEQLRERLLRE